MELKTPVLVLERSLRPDSGGAGKFRGGLGLQTRVRSLVEGRWNAAPPGARSSCPPWGLWGGKEGTPGATFVKEANGDEFRKSPTPRYAGPSGTEVLYQTAGGGGWGNPLERPAETVLRDVLEGYVSQEVALSEYGVVLAPCGQAVDWTATEARRAAEEA